MKQELMDKFGEELIENGRDSSILNCLTIVEGRTQIDDYHHIVKTLSKMDREQIDAIKALVYQVVDIVLHNVLYTFEASDIATIKLQDESNAVEDIRKVASGDLQGYAFEWAEKFSQQPLSHEPFE